MVKRFLIPAMLIGLLGIMLPTLLVAHDTATSSAQPSQAAVTKPSIPSGLDFEALSVFMTPFFVFEQATLDEAAYILDIEEGRLTGEAGRLVYARNIREPLNTRYDIVRPVVTLREYGTGKALGIKTRLVGSAVLLGGRDPHSLRIEANTMEVLRGDFLVQQQPSTTRQLRSGAPLHQIDAHVIDINDGVNAAGRYQLVNIDRGAKDGLMPGDILAISSKARAVVDQWGNKPQSGDHPIISPQVAYKPHGEYVQRQAAQVTHFGDIAVVPMFETVAVPHEHIGYILVYATHDSVSQAIVLDASREIMIGFPAHNP